MPIFAQLFASFFGALAAFLARIFAARVAIRVAAVTAIAALGTGLVVAFNEFVAPLALAIFSTQYGQLLGLVFPPISGTVITGLFTLWIAAMLYRLQASAIRTTAGI